MSGLITPKPVNVTLKGNLKYVDNDVHSIAERVREVDPNLRIVLHEGHPKPWVVMEIGIDGQERFVSRYEELDGRIIEHLQYMRAVPFEQRLERLQKEADKANAKIGHMSDESFERFAYDFQKALVDSNISNPMWNRNYRRIAKKKMKKREADA